MGHVMHYTLLLCTGKNAHLLELRIKTPGYFVGFDAELSSVYYQRSLSRLSCMTQQTQAVFVPNVSNCEL